jgi:predicted AlkP superfamily pyrophosphatase or phosphodiesterase
MKRFVLLLSALLLPLLLLSPFAAAQTNPATQPGATAPRVLIVSIDGLRPDMALRARTPNLHALMDVGCFSFWARTTPLAITLPSHVSMLTGVTPRRHEVEWNKDLPLKKPVYPLYPTLFEVAHHAGYTTAMAAGKSKFTTLAKPGTIDWTWLPSTSKTEDPDVADAAVQIIREHQPQVLFVHLPSTDNLGHASGWGSEAQIAAIETADESLGRVLSALDFVGQRRRTFVLVTADHGGAGLSHGPDDPRARHIPWIAAGPGVRRHVDLTTDSELVINTEDTFATACHVLKIPIATAGAKKLDGKVITEIFDAELLTDR